MSASLWGLAWWPVKWFATSGLSGAMLATAAYGVIGIAGLPMMLGQIDRWRSQSLLLGAIALLGGWANASFVQAMLAGDVVRVMLLFYLAPVWSVLGGRLMFGENIEPLRAAAMALALAGAFLVIGGSGFGDRAPSSVDLLALSAGMAFAGSNLATRAARRVPLLSKTVAVFLGCTLLGAISVWLQQDGWPSLDGRLAAALGVFALVWLVAGTAAMAYGVSHLEAGRAGVILTAELCTGVLSAVLIGERSLSALEWSGATMIAAAVLSEAAGAVAGRRA